MEENSKKDTLSRKALFSQFLQKTPIECYLSNKKLKSKSGYTWHLKKCSQNVHVSQQNKAEPISPTAIAPPLPTSFPISFTNFNYTYRYNENIPNSPNNSNKSQQLLPH